MSQLQALPVFYSPAMVAQSESFSPSASKPSAVVASWRDIDPRLDIRDPVPVAEAMIAGTHSPDFVRGVLEGTRKNGFGNCSLAVARSLPFTTGSLLSGAREALRNEQVAISPTSGFHHAGYDQPSGFCTFNGLVITAQTLQREGLARRVGILDFDMHYGDGTDELIKHHGLDWIVHYTAGREFGRPDQALDFLKGIPDRMRHFADCDVLLYQAGADPHIDDPLGGWLTVAQLALRDELVFVHAKSLGIPVVWNLAGGYQSPLSKVLEIHDNTLRACLNVYIGPAQSD